MGTAISNIPLALKRCPRSLKKHPVFCGLLTEAYFRWDCILATNPPFPRFTTVTEDTYGFFRSPSDFYLPTMGTPVSRAFSGVKQILRRKTQPYIYGISSRKAHISIVYQNFWLRASGFRLLLYNCISTVYRARRAHVSYPKDTYIWLRASGFSYTRVNKCRNIRLYEIQWPCDSRFEIGRASCRERV